MKTRYGQISAVNMLLCIIATGCMNEAQFVSNNADQKKRQVIIEKEFSTARIEDGQISFKPAFGKVEQTLKLKQALQTASLRQIERPLLAAEFTQGHDGSSTEEEFKISEAGKVDVLLVIDNSGSMSDEQDKLKDKLPALTKHLASTDWQVAVVTTDSSCLAGGKIIKKSSASSEADFAAAILAGISGSGDEKGIKQAQLALSGQCANGNYNWLRDDASIAVLFVTDENNTCKEFGFDPCEPGNRPGELTAKLKSLRGDRARAYGLTWRNNEPGCTSSNGESVGSRYEEVINNTGGFRGSICANDYTNTLEQISRDVARNVRYEFDLKFPPVRDGVTVAVDGMDHKDYEVSGNRLKLKNIRGAEIILRVSYRYGALPKFDRIYLPDAAPGTITTWVNGAQLELDDFEFDAATHELYLTQMPPDYAKISLNYRQDGALPTTFDFSSRISSSAIEQVWINDQPRTEFNYDSNSHVLNLTTPPQDGAEIKISWFDERNKVTQYPLSGFDPAAQPTLSVRDEVNSEPIAFEFSGDTLTIAPEEIYEGRKVIVSFDYQNQGKVMTHELPFEPIAGSLELHAPEASADCIQDLSIAGKQLSYSCQGERLGQIDVTYKYVAERYTQFDLGPLPAEGSLYAKVFVDGAAIEDYDFEGSIVTIPEKLMTPESTVKIMVSKL